MSKISILLLAGAILAASSTSCTVYHGISAPPGGSPILLTTCTTYMGSTWDCQVHECARDGQILQCRELTVENHPDHVLVEDKSTNGKLSGESKKK